MPDLICEAPTRIFQHTLKNGGLANGRFAKLFFATIRAAIGRIRTFWARCWQSLGPGGRIRTILRCSGPDVGKVSAPEDEPQTTKTQKLVITSPPCATPPPFGNPRRPDSRPPCLGGGVEAKKNLEAPPHSPPKPKDIEATAWPPEPTKKHRGASGRRAPVGGGRWPMPAARAEAGPKDGPRGHFLGPIWAPKWPKTGPKKNKKLSGDPLTTKEFHLLLGSAAAELVFQNACWPPIGSPLAGFGRYFGGRELVPGATFWAQSEPAGGPAVQYKGQSPSP